jgi:serine/threonine-protein kinase
VEPARLGLGDLDSVLATALRRAPAERYQTVAIFAEDLQRWLRHEPVSVRGDSLPYRARKFLRRHARAAVAVAAGALMAGAYASTVLIDRAHVRRALAEATTSARKAEQVTDFAVAMFEASGRGPAYADSLSARELLARGVASAHELAGQPEIEAQMLDLIGRIRLEIGDYDGARPVLREALDIRRRTLGENHPDVASSLMNNAALIGASERNRSVAVAMLREASIIRERLFGRSDPRTTDAVYELASALHMSGAYGEARPLFDEWLAAVQRQPMPLTPTRADQLATLGSIMQITGRMDVAERLARQALQLNRALYGPRHARVASSMDDLGGIMLDDERLAGADTLLHGAVAIMRENYPDGHPDLAYMLRDLGYYLMDAHAPLEADTVWRESAALFRRYQGTGSLGYANSMVYVGRVATLRGRYAESEQTLRDVLGMAVTRRGPVNPVGARANVYMGLLLVLEGRSADAEPYLLKGFTMSGNIRAGWQARAVAATELARLYEQQGRRNEAAKYRAVAVVH